MSKQAVVGILAHVDAGKTTLAEAMLFNAGRIRKRGRVDDGDSHLDTNAIERERGITIFSSQAVLDHGDAHVMLVDAPGHVDFSAEAERTLRALDYAILVVGANDGVQGHTETLWRCLRAMTSRRSSLSTKSIWRILAAMFYWRNLGSAFPRAARCERTAGGRRRLGGRCRVGRGGPRGVS